MQLTVATWNIHKCIGGLDRRYRPGRVIDLLAHYEPDILFLQEVDEDAKRSRHHRQVSLIGDALGLRHHEYGVTHRLRTRGHYGNAIISRWPLHDVHHVDLTIGRRKRRGAIVARTRVRGEQRTRSLVLYNLHLGLAGSERDKQLRRFLAHEPIDALQHRTPAILGGDFNDLWGSLGPKLLEPAGFKRAGPIVRTFPAAAPIRPLDGLFVRGDVHVERCFASRHRLARSASDHRPIVARMHVGAR